jgi:Rieske Fe-S protein
VTHEPPRGMETTRRAALAGVGLAGLAASVAACGTGSKSAATAGTPAGATPAQAGATGSAQAASGGGSALATTSEIPLGGGKVFAAEQVVVTQPTAGQFKAFSAICTHAQCVVDQVANGTIGCPCHGSEFSVKDGHVVSGPAPSPLPPKSIKVAADSITLA